MQYDLIIIGSGSVGAAAGYYARRAGLNVLMTDAHQPPHQEGSHHGSSRLIRHAYGEGEKYVPLVLRAQQLWDELAEISGEAVFERTGVINLGPASSAFLANVAASARAFQLEVEELDAQAVMQRWPEIRLPMTIGRFSNPLPAYCAANWPSKPGSVWRGKQAARSYSTVRSRLFITMLTGSPSIPSTVNIMVKNCWSAPAPGSPACFGPPIQPVRKVFAWYQADGRYSSKNHFPAFTGELPNGDQYYGFPAEDNELKIGKHNGGQPISTPQERVAFGAVASDGSESFPFLRNVLPGIGGCLHGASCTYDNTVDEDFIIDTLPGRPDTLLITGLSGHGFKFAPVLGEIASQFAQGEASSFNLAPFSLARFNA